MLDYRWGVENRMNDELFIDKRDLTEQAYELLKTYILTRKFHPNEKLSIDRLAKLLGVSRTPAKDAVNRLAADGLITVEPRVGSFVTPITAKDIQEIFDLRLLYELYAAEKGFENVTQTEISEMEQIVVQMASCIEGNRYRREEHARFIELDHRLHRFIIDSPQNSRLTRTYDGLGIHLNIARVYYVKELQNAAQGQEEHKAIVQAYRQHDLEALKTVLKQHITGVRDLVLQCVESAGGVL